VASILANCCGVFGNNRPGIAAEKQSQHCACRVAEATAKSELLKPAAASVDSNLGACLSKA